MNRIDELIDWLSGGAMGSPDVDAVVARIGDDLRAGGVLVDRLMVFERTLHPSVCGRAFRWIPDAPTRVFELSYETFDKFAGNSPVRSVRETKREVRARIEPGPAGRAFTVFDDLALEAFTDYVALPLLFTNGEVHAIAFATKNAAGFSESDLEIIRSLMRPFTRVAEIMSLYRTASMILNTYVGRNSGARILAGRIQKGDFETLRAVIWFSDLRGFTEMSSRIPAGEVIATLNRVFECQVPAIDEHGGEVLKFIGDGMLAIFPLADDADAAAVVDRALAAADIALAAVAALDSSDAPLRIGLALHVGELAYGNIGGHNRLDFTAIGSAVNIAARLEGLTSKLGRPLVVSEDLAQMTKRPLDDLGAFDLKGVPAPVRVFAPSVSA
jgi:adenylate cyclase